MNKFSPPGEFTQDIKNRISKDNFNKNLSSVKKDILDHMNWSKYAYNFSWFGRPIIQIPQDTITFQEIIWEVKPDLIIETGIAHGGSIIFSASMLALLETFELVVDPMVLGIDIEIREHNLKAINNHPASKWINMIEGSSISREVINKVEEIAKNKKKILLFLDSNHTHSHVLAELNAYTQFVSLNSYCVILDTGIEDIDQSAIAKGRNWGKGNSPKSALNEFLQGNDNFVVDDFFHEKAWVTSAPGGIIKKIN
jgi:cephalosporin hydroxylase